MSEETSTTPTKDIAAQLLADAAEKVDAAIKLLDKRQGRCGDCGVRHYENRIEGLTYDRVQELPMKLRRLASGLRDTSTTSDEVTTKETA